MIYGYARVSTDGQRVNAQVAALRRHGAGKVFREVASGAKTERMQLRRLLDQLEAGDVLLVTRLDRMARSTRDLSRLRDAPARLCNASDQQESTLRRQPRILVDAHSGLRPGLPMVGNQQFPRPTPGEQPS